MSILNDYLSKVGGLVDAGAATASPALGHKRRTGWAPAPVPPPSPAPIPTPVPFPAAGGPNLAGASAITNPSQILIPTMSWNWNAPSPGTISLDLLKFADTIPLSMASSKEYAPSGDRFAQNYQTFLQFIDASRFPSASLLARAKAAATEPTTDPVNSRAPEGWTKVTIAGVQRWAPVWSLSQSAQNWGNAVKRGVISNPGTISIDISGASSGSDFILQSRATHNDKLSPVPNITTLIKTITMSARAWGQISIYPGAWFNSGLVKLGANYIPDKDVFFGSAGLLRGRVTSFIVAFEVTFRFSSKQMIPPSLEGDLSKASQVYALGVPVSLDKSGQSPPSNDPSLNFIGSDQAPSIVAAILESYG